MAYLNVLKLQEALTAMNKKFKAFDLVESIPLKMAVGRYLAKDYFARENLPAFRRSMVDGYGVRSEDLMGASEQSPMLLDHIGYVQMGKPAQMVVQPGQAVYVATGGEIPKGADAMVMVEYTEVMGPDVAIFTTPRQGEHIVDVGEDIRADQKILSKGLVLGPHHMGLLASLGIWEVEVIKNPALQSYLQVMNWWTSMKSLAMAR